MLEILNKIISKQLSDQHKSMGRIVEANNVLTAPFFPRETVTC